MKKFLSLALVLVLVVTLFSACGGTKTTEEPKTEAPATEAPKTEEPKTEEPATEDPAAKDGTFTAAMITDVGGVNDESFNQSAWQGMERLKSELGVEVSFIESQKDADYAPNLEKKTDENPDIIWGIGFLLKDAIGEAAENNPDQLYALVDDSFPDGEMPNVISVVFNAEQSSFEVGYAAAHKTETNRVGFIVGMESPVMDRFKYGYMAGVEYGARELGKDITVDYAVAESFADSAKGKALAQKMYTDGADVIFHAAGQTGTGVIEAAKEMNKMVIGVDLDQNKLAPDNVITSSLKNVDVAVFEISKRVMAGEQLGGTTVVMGLAEGGVGIAPSSNLHLSEELLTKIDDLAYKMIEGEITAPITQEEFDTFKAAL